MKDFTEVIDPTMYSKETGCPFCSGKKTKRIIPDSLLSDFYCEGCHAQFYSFENVDEAKRGHFTGTRMEVSNEQLYGFGHQRGAVPGGDTNEQ